MNIKRIAYTVTCGLALGVLTSSAQAETVTTTKTTVYTGVVSDINPTASTIILKSDTSPAPVTYTFTKDTAFVDSEGNVVSAEQIRNAPVRVEYSTEGDRTIVRRVIRTGPVVVTPPAVVVPVK